MAVMEMRNCLMSEYERKRTGDKSRPVMRVSTAQKHARILMILLLYMGGRLHRLGSNQRLSMHSVRLMLQRLMFYP